MTFFAAVLPSLGLAVLFWFVMRAILHADRREREAALRYERAHPVTETDPPSA